MKIKEISYVEGLEKAAKFFEALGHPIRLAIIKCVLESREASWSDIVKHLELLFGRMNPNTVNFHLTKLVLDGVLEKRGNKYVIAEKVARRILAVIVEELGPRDI